MFATRDAEVGWRNLAATHRNALADTWDFLTKTPTLTTPTNATLRGELENVRRNGEEFARWQHKPTAKGDARIWFFVADGTVFLEHVFTAHPNQTK